MTGLKTAVCAGSLPPSLKRDLSTHKTWYEGAWALALPPWDAGGMVGPVFFPKSCFSFAYCTLPAKLR